MCVKGKCVVVQSTTSQNTLCSDKKNFFFKSTEVCY